MDKQLTETIIHNRTNSREHTLQLAKIALEVRGLELWESEGKIDLAYIAKDVQETDNKKQYTEEDLDKALDGFRRLSEAMRYFRVRLEIASDDLAGAFEKEAIHYEGNETLYMELAVVEAEATGKAPNWP
jgi:hypothetical protein